MEKRVYNDPTWRKMLLETPSGFALFEVDEVALKEPDDIWVYFRKVTVAQKFLCVLGFVKFDDKSSAWDGETRPSKDLMGLIQNFCDDKNPLYVQHADLQDVIVKNLSVKCSYDPNVADEVAWGLKNVLHEVIPQERDNITSDYCLPMSKGLRDFLKENSINVSPTMFTADFISEMGLAQYLNITLKQVPKILRESFDKHVCRIGESIENDLKYARVLARILIPQMIPEYDLSKMVSSELALKIQEADRAATQYRAKLTIHDIETILGGLTHLLAVPKQRDDIMTKVKLMEAKLRKAELQMLEDTDGQSMREHRNLEHLKFRRTLLETPSGFAIFDVNEVVFKYPEHTWTWFTDTVDSREVVLALGFVEVHDKSIVRNSCNGPGKELSRLIQKLCADKKKLIVQDDDLKSVIEEKLEVKCYTKSSTGADSLDDLIWGLKYVLHEFIPREQDNLTEEYYLPMSMGLQRALKSHGVNVSPVKMDRTFVYFFGCLANLDFTSAFVSKIFRKSFDSRILGIGELIKDNLVYAQVTAKILVPESQRELDFFKVLPGNLAELAARLAKCKARSGEAISAHDKKIILGVVEYLSTVPKRRDCFLRFLNGGSTEELQRIEEDCVRGTNDALIDNWILSVTTKPLMVEDQVQEAKKIGKMELQNVEETDPEVEALRKNKSSDDKSVQGHEIGLSCQDNQRIGKGPAVEEDSSDKDLNVIYNKAIPNDETESNQQSKPLLDDSFEKFHTLEAEKSVSTDDDSINLEASDVVKTQKQPESTSEKEDHLVIPKEADNVDGRHYSIEGGIKAIPNAVGPDVGAKAVFVDGAADITESVCSSSVAMDDSLKKSQVEIITVGSTNYVDKKVQNEKGSTDLSFHESFEKIQQAVSGKGNCWTIEQNEETMAKMRQILDKPHDIHKVVLMQDMMLNAYTTSGPPSDETKVENISTGGKKQGKATMEDSSSGENGMLQGTDDTKNKEQNADATIGPASDETEVAQNTNITEDAKEADQSEATTGESNNLPDTDDTGNKEQNADTTGPASDDEPEVAQNTNMIEGGKTKDMTSEVISTAKSPEDAKEAHESEATAEDPRSGESNCPGGHNGGSTEELHRIEEDCVRGTNDALIDNWILSVTTKPLMVEDQVQEAKKTGKMELQNVEETDPEVEALRKNKSSDDKSVQGHEIGLSCQDNQRTGKGPAVEEDSSDKDLNVIYNKAIPNDETESNQQSKPLLDDSFEKFHTLEAEKSVSTDDSINLEASDVVKTQKQPESTSEKDHLVIPKEADNVDGPASYDEPEVAQNTNIIEGGKIKDTTSEVISTTKDPEDAKEAHQSEATAEDPRSGESNNLRDAEHKEQNADTKCPASDENKAAQNTYVKGKTECTTNSATGDEPNEEKIIGSDRIHSSLRDLFNSGNLELSLNRDNENSENAGKTKETFGSEDAYRDSGDDEKANTTKEKKPLSKICLHLFRGRSSKDNMSVSTKDNALLSPKDTMRGKVACMWRFR